MNISKDLSSKSVRSYEQRPAFLNFLRMRSKKIQSHWKFIDHMKSPTKKNRPKIHCDFPDKSSPYCLSFKANNAGQFARKNIRHNARAYWPFFTKAGWRGISGRPDSRCRCRRSGFVRRCKRVCPVHRRASSLSLCARKTSRSFSFPRFCRRRGACICCLRTVRSGSRFLNRSP